MSETPIKRVFRWIRIAVSVTVLVVTGLLVVVGGFLYLTRSEAPDWLTRTVSRLVESRAGAELAVSSVRVGPAAGLCDPGFDVAGVQLELGDPGNRARFSVARLQWNPANGSIEGVRAEIPGDESETVVELSDAKFGGGEFEANGLRVGPPTPGSGLAIESIHAAPRTSGVRIRALTQTPEPLSSGTRIAVAQIDIGPLSDEGEPSALVIGEVVVRRVDFRTPVQPDAPPICERLAGVFDPLERTRDGVRSGMERIHAGLASARRWLRIILIAAIAGFFLLKLVPSWDARRWWSRLALAGATVALPTVIYFLGRSRSGSLPLVCIGFACAALMALALFFGAYRRFGGWHHKGAAVALDVAGAVILPLFLLNGFVRSLDFQLPSGLRVERTTVEGISGELETAACEGLNQVRINNARIEIEGVDAPFTRLLDGKPAINVARVGIEAPVSQDGPAITIENPAGNETVRLDEITTGILNISASLDIEQRRYESIGARLLASGSVESPTVRNGVQRIRFLRDRATELSTARFEVAANAAGPRSEPPESDSAAGAGSGAANFSIDAAIGLDLAGCTLPIDANLAINTRDLKANAVLERRGEIIEVRNLSSTAGSRVKFRGGTAHTTIGDRLTLRGAVEDIGAKFESSDLAIKNAKFDAALPAGCSPAGKQTLAAMLAGIGFTTSDGLDADLDRVTFSLDREIGRPLGKIGAVSEIHAVALSSALPPAEGETPNAPWLTADLPYTRFELEGTASGEALPRHIDGTADITISRFASQPRQPENLAFGMDEPVRFSANLQAPEIEIPAQQNTFRQSITSDALEAVPLDFSFHAQAGQGGGPARIRANVLTDWISFPTPNPPRHIEFHEISRLALTTQGKLSGLPLDEDLIRQDDLPPLCREGVGLRLNPLRVEVTVNSEGAGPIVRVHGKAGPEIRIRLNDDGSLTEIGDSGLAIRTKAIERHNRKFSAPNARIEAVDLRLKVNGIQPGGMTGAGGSLTFEADFARGPEWWRVSSSLATDGGQSLLGFDLDGSADRIKFATRNTIEVNRLTRSFEPFLQPLQCDLSWLTPDISIRRLAGSVALEGGELAAAELDAAIAPGSLLAIDLDAAPEPEVQNSPGHLRKIRLAVDHQNSLNLTARLARVEGPSSGLTANLQGNLPLKVEAQGRNGDHHEATLELQTEALLALRPEPPAQSPILSRGRKVFSDLRRHAANASRVFGDRESADPGRPLDLAWDLAVRDSPAAKPFEIKRGGAESEAVRSALAIDRADFTWKRAGQAEVSHFETSGTVAAASTLHCGYLILEGDSTLAFDFSLDRQPGCSFNFQTPFAVAFRDEFESAPSGPGSLWDAATFDSLWASYQPSFASRASEPLVNCRSLTDGDLSILQATFPATEPRIAIGHGDHLQLNLPINGSLLFGKADGRLQADIEWLDDHAALSAGAVLDLSNFQAAALGRQAIPGHLPFVEDEFNAKVNFLSRGIGVGRDGVQMPPANPFEAPGYPPFDLDLTLSRARPDGTLPGVLQATSRVNLKLMNEFLESVLAGVRIPAPPTALRYQGLDLNLAVKNGIIQTDPMFLNLRGVRLLATEPIEVSGDIRVHWKRDGWTLPDYKFSDFVSSMQRFVSAAPAE